MLPRLHAELKLESSIRVHPHSIKHKFPSNFSEQLCKRINGNFKGCSVWVEGICLGSNKCDLESSCRYRFVLLALEHCLRVYECYFVRKSFQYLHALICVEVTATTAFVILTTTSYSLVAKFSIFYREMHQIQANCITMSYSSQERQQESQRSNGLNDPGKRQFTFLTFSQWNFYQLNHHRREHRVARHG